jgi:xanthine dehydrogenase accessory factor
MRAELLRMAAELAERGEPFALALVVRREPYSSAHAGDMAIVTETGVFHGWLGGTCTQPTVVREAREALAEGRPRLVALSPEPESDRRAGVAVRPMTCHSGGTVDIYLEPVLPPPRLVVFGVAPVARALCRLGKAMGYAVDLVDPDAHRDAFPEADRVHADVASLQAQRHPRGAGLFAAVATMGQRDEPALLEALSLAPAWVGVVASRRRYEEIREVVAARGGAEAVRAVRNPAGLDIGAKTPEEIALSILADVVRTRRAAEAGVSASASSHPSPGASTHPSTSAPLLDPDARDDRRGPPPSRETEVHSGGSEPHPARAAPSTARDPICNMTVQIAGARHTAEHAGRTWYFCKAGCRERFLADPDRWASRAEPVP